MNRTAGDRRGADATKDMLDYVDETLQDGGSVADKHYTGSPDDWIEICSDNVYIPTKSDVGRVLKIQCSAVSQSRDTASRLDILAGPVTTYSAVVLTAPVCPPTRPTRACSPVSAGGEWPSTTSFRVLSYNILAEVYATRQVGVYVCPPA